MPELTIVIPTLNRGECLRKTIGSLLEQSFKDWELIVVDQSAVAELTATWIARLRDGRIHHRTLQPPSVAHARNFGISLARAELMIFIDDDVELEPGFLDAYREAFADQSVDAVAGRVVLQGDPVRDHPLAIGLGGTETGSFNCLIDQDATTAQGCNMAFRKSILLTLGGFDTRFVENDHRDESDLCFRLRKAGGRIVYRKKAALAHYPAGAGGCRPAGGQAWNKIIKCRNETLFFLKHWPFWRAPLFARNQIYPGLKDDLRPKEPQPFAQMLYLLIGFVIGLWIYLTKTPAKLPEHDVLP